MNQQLEKDIQAMRAMQDEYDSLLERWKNASPYSQEVANLHASFKARERKLGELVEGGLFRRMLEALGKV